MTVQSDVAVVNTFGIGSRHLRLAMALLGVTYVVITAKACRDVTGTPNWAALLAGFALFVVIGVIILFTVGDPLPVRPTVVVSVLVPAAVVLGLAPLPHPPTHVMMTGPPIGTSVIMLAFVAVRGRPAAAWGSSAVITVLVTVWSIWVGEGWAWGLGLTMPGYAIMIMGSLFSVMLRPMSRQIYVLRRREERQAAHDAAAAAAAEVREREVAIFDDSARPILTAIVDGHEFSTDEVKQARLLEARLRDGIRAPGFDVPAMRAAVWAARSRGATVTLLDDGALAALDARVRRRTGEDLIDAVVRILDEVSAGRVTVRIKPPGRSLLASVTIDAPDRDERVDFGYPEGALPDGIIGDAADGSTTASSPQTVSTR
ncbi:hypothetical protein QSJ18_14330 [Gordonia sp. ABSL1-1]|uniref:hypothetical protein n=1 Tax=Gordonia sp. ABSL1-1 TaxID=3053923 RepID=UPI002572FB3D|nr:hypothetical protein [Gordonia sp. ABSL1-1]MDL9937927.1 hypothetical protein [Gordonia sp. ABSL1-1]